MSLVVAAHGSVVPSRRVRLPLFHRCRGTGNAATRVVRPDTKCWGKKPSTSDGRPLDLVVFTVIVDDLVFADGTTQMEQLGGGGPQTAWGFRTHSRDFSVGLAAGVGPDLPEQCIDWLEKNGIDMEGLALVRDTDSNEKNTEGSSWEGGGTSASAFERRDADLAGEFRPTPRAWQITENDGRRTQVWRTVPSPGLYAMLRPPASTLPERYKSASAFHIGVHPERPDFALLQDLRSFATTHETLISVEPFTSALSHVSCASLQKLCQSCDVFSPNELEAVSLVGTGTPVELCERLLNAGAKVVCIRRGALGAVAVDSRKGSTTVWSVPAYLDESETKDVTGCGNAFCGAFFASLLNGEPVEEALCWGSATASVMAQNIGVPTEPAGDAETRDKVRKRFEEIRPQAIRIE